MKNEMNRPLIEKKIHNIARESGQLMESIQWEHEALKIVQLRDALAIIENEIKELKEILGE